MEVTKSKEPTLGAKEEQKPEIDPAIIDELMKGYQHPEDMMGPGEILEQITKRVNERILGAEMSHYLGNQTHLLGLTQHHQKVGKPPITWKEAASQFFLYHRTVFKGVRYR